MTTDKFTYLGDGLYFDLDNRVLPQVKIFTNNGYCNTNEIFLDQYLAQALVDKLVKWLETQ